MVTHRTRRSWFVVLPTLCALSMSVHGQPADPAKASGPESAEAPEVDLPETARAITEESPQDKEPEVLVLLKDGRRVSGLLVEQSDEGLLVRVAGIVGRFGPNQVESFRVLPPILDRYRQLREAVGDDPDQIVRLAEWLQSRERYELAYTEVERALRLDPAHLEAKNLRTLLQEQIILKHRSKVGAASPEKPRPVGVDEFSFLSTEQINLIKVFELDLRDRPRLLVPRDVVEQMLEKYTGHPLVPVTREGRDAVLHRPPSEILDLMFRLQAREYYGKVQVLDQPRSMVAFRDSVARTWLNGSCATSQCHGGMDAGRLILYNRKAGSEPVLYTNYFILDQFRTRSGQPLIDWEKPERSVLLQMGLPRKESMTPHPEVPMGQAGKDGWRTVFRSPADRQFQEAVAWIKSMYRPHPEYPVDYTPLRPFTVQGPAGGPAPTDSPGRTEPAGSR